MSGEGIPLAELVPVLPPDDWWWGYQDQGDVITWRGGSGVETIGYRQEISSIFSHLPPQCRPPYGSIVLLVAACRGGVAGLSRARRRLDALVVRLGGTPPDRELVAHVDRLLRRHVATLPEELRRPSPVRHMLAEMICEGAAAGPRGDPPVLVVDKWSPRVARAVAEPFPFRIGTLRDELRPLLRGAGRITEPAVRRRLATGLEDPPAAAEPEKVPIPRGGGRRGEGDAAMIRGVAAIARHVMAVLSLPRPLDAPDDLPQGGVADITNRGPLDRLLLSELAHDETTLAVRLALGEALYHRRELAAPPPPRGRHVLVDAGVRMWGMPRVYAAAVALALRRQAGPGVPAAVHRAGRRGLVPVDLDSEAGLVEQLAALETAAHPAAALAPFAAAVAAAGGPADAVIVTCDDVLADPEFERALAAAPLDTVYLVCVARDGGLRLLARSRRGTRLLKQATLDVERLLGAGSHGGRPTPTRRWLHDPDPHDLPAIFGVDPFPLLLPTRRNLTRSWLVDGVGWLSLVRDGRLLLWDRPGHGPRQIAEGVPGPVVFAAEPAAGGGRVLAVVGRPRGPLFAVAFDPADGTVGLARLDAIAGPGTTVAIHRGRVLVRGPLAAARGADAVALREIDPGSGAEVSSCPAPAGGRQIGRIVHNHDGGGSVALAAGPARCEPLPGDPLVLRNALAAFETSGIDGVTIVLQTRRPPEKSGWRYTTWLLKGFRHGAEGTTVELPAVEFPRVNEVAADGRSFRIDGWVGGPRSPVSFVVRVPEGTRTSVSGDSPRSTGPGPEFPAAVATVPVGGVVVTAAGQLAFLRPHFERAAWTIELVEGGLSLVLRDLDALPGPSARFGRKFSVRGHRLRTLRFGDGTQVWLDSRGLVHLRSSVAALPQTTLLLLAWPHRVAGWLSDGRVFGPAPFHGGDAVADRVVHDEVLGPMAAAIRM